MTQERERLIKLSLFLDEISKISGNEWFVELLKSKYSININPNYLDSDQIQKLTLDLRRSKDYLKTVDKSIWTEAIKFYCKIKNPELRNSLQIDYKEMRIADKYDDIIEFTRRIVMQLENCIHYLCNFLNAHEIIKNNPNQYQNAYYNLLQGNYAFFNTDGMEVKYIHIPITSKIFFIKQYYSFGYNYTDMSEMIKIRNKSSHRGDYTPEEAKIIEFAKANILERKASYFKCYDTFLRNMKDLYN